MSASGSRLEEALVRRLYLRGVSPDHLTFAGLGLSCLAGLLGPLAPALAGGSLLAARGLGALEGALARRREAAPTRALRDSAVDRYGEFAVLLGAWARLSRLGYGASGAVLTLLALQGCLMLTCTRPPAEGAGTTQRPSLFERQSVLVIAFGLLLSPWEALLHVEPGGALATALSLLAVGTNAVALTRVARASQRVRPRRFWRNP